jgi:hypothetical protein
MKKNKSVEKIRPVPLYGALVCGAVIFIIGLYMFFTNASAQGMVRGGRGGGKEYLNMNGTTAMLFGFAICIFPVYQLIRQRKNTNPNNIGSGASDMDGL